MRNIIATLLLLAGWCTFSSAEESMTTYYMTDMVNAKNNRLEMWTKRDLSTKSRTILEITKQSFGKKLAPETEKQTYWSSEMRFAGKETYLVERYTASPTDMDPGDTSFGYVEERRVADDKPVDNWPMFYGVEEILGLRRAVFRIFISHSQLMVIIKDFEEDEYHFPMRETRLITDGGKVTDYVIYARRK